MSSGRERIDQSVRIHQTVTTPTSPSITDDDVARQVPGLALVVECDRVAAGGALLSLRGVSRVIIGRGRVRQIVRQENETVRWDIPDPKLSSEHAILERTRDGFVLVDRQSKNGTFVGRRQIQSTELDFGDLARLGHGLFALVEDCAEPRVAGQGDPSVATFSAPLMRELARVERLSASPIPLVILGETGTGKEVVARLVHARSGRPGEFVAVNCGALPRELVESHLFGHVRGAFSGAVRDEIGFVRAAEAGTLFLDEIGDLPLPAQTALLRLLEEREVTPVGAHRSVRVDVRVLAATHRPLERMVDAGAFRADLFARLSGFVTRLPPLRERIADVGLLLGSWIGDGRIPDLRLHWDAALRMLEHPWPLNVRELLQCVQAGARLTTDGVLRVSDLPSALRAPIETPSLVPIMPEDPASLSPEDLALRDELQRRLSESEGNISQVARDMGKVRQQVQRWIRRFGLKRD